MGLKFHHLSVVQVQPCHSPWAAKPEQFIEASPQMAPLLALDLINCFPKPWVARTLGSMARLQRHLRSPWWCASSGRFTPFASSSPRRARRQVPRFGPHWGSGGLWLQVLRSLNPPPPEGSPTWRGLKRAPCYQQAQCLREHGLDCLALVVG